MGNMRFATLLLGQLVSLKSCERALSNDTYWVNEVGLDQRVREGEKYQRGSRINEAPCDI